LEKGGVGFYRHLSLSFNKFYSLLNRSNSFLHSLKRKNRVYTDFWTVPSPPLNSANKSSDSINKPSDNINKSSNSINKPSDSIYKSSNSANKSSDNINKLLNSVDKSSYSINKSSNSANKSFANVCLFVFPIFSQLPKRYDMAINLALFQ